MKLPDYALPFNHFCYQNNLVEIHKSLPRTFEDKSNPSAVDPAGTPTNQGLYPLDGPQTRARAHKCLKSRKRKRGQVGAYHHLSKGVDFLVAFACACTWFFCASPTDVFFPVSCLFFVFVRRFCRGGGFFSKF